MLRLQENSIEIHAGRLLHRDGTKTPRAHDLDDRERKDIDPGVCVFRLVD